MRLIKFASPGFVGAGVAAALIAGHGRSTSTVLADSVKCDLSQYKSSPGLTAAMDQDLLVVAWNGQGGTELRARLAIDGGRPTMRDLAVRKTGGQWATIGENLAPEYHVVSGVRRLPNDQGN